MTVETATPPSTDDTPREVNIGDLLRSPEFQIRKQTDRQKVTAYANVLRSGREMPPVRVAIVDGAPVLVDGHHRVAAHEAAGRMTVMAVIVTASASEARWLAAQANLEHGLPLKKPEVRKAFGAFIQARKHRLKGGKRLMSLRDIAKELGGSVSHMAIHRWMKTDFPKLAKEYGGGPGPTLNEPPGPEGQQEAFFSGAMKAIAEATVVGRTIQDSALRGRLIVAMENGMKELSNGGPWTPPEPPEPPDF